tara:strand:- start:565 stop:810 length:246 start_codon:yes stop_codon:yes gene_type:complete
MSVIQNSLPETKFSDLEGGEKVMFIAKNLSFAMALYFFLDYILTCQVKTQDGMYSLFFTFIFIIILFVSFRFNKIKQIISR